MALSKDKANAVWEGSVTEGYGKIPRRPKRRPGKTVTMMRLASPARCRAYPLLLTDAGKVRSPQVMEKFRAVLSGSQAKP